MEYVSLPSPLRSRSQQARFRYGACSVKTRYRCGRQKQNGVGNALSERRFNPLTSGRPNAPNREQKKADRLLDSGQSALSLLHIQQRNRAPYGKDIHHDNNPAQHGAPYRSGNSLHHRGHRQQKNAATGHAPVHTFILQDMRTRNIRFGLLLVLLILYGAVTGKARAQAGIRVVVSGQLFGLEEDSLTRYPLQGAQVEYLSLPDSVPCGGTASWPDGTFRSDYRSEEGRTQFLVRITYVGMETVERVCNAPFAIGKTGEQEAPLGKLVLKTLPITIEEAVIVGKLKKMYMEGDTVIFNTDAYRMPDGSLLLELVRRLPGLKCDALGNLTYQGRSIEEIRLNGASFFRHDMSVALRNIPANRLEQLRIYETNREDSIARPQKMTVLDVKTKKPVNQVKMANAVAAAQSKGRHLLDGSVNSYVKEKTELSVKGKSVNTPDPYSFAYSLLGNAAGFLLGSGFLPVTSKEKLEQGGEISLKHQFQKVEIETEMRYNRHRTVDEQAAVEATYLPSYSRFDHSELRGNDRGQGIDGHLGLKGDVSERTTWHARANFGYEYGRARTNSLSAMFRDDPSAATTGNPLHVPAASLQGLLLNRTERQADSRNSRHSLGAEFGMEHTFGEKDRTLAWEIAASATKSKRKEHLHDQTRYYEFEDSATLYNRYIETPVTKRKWQAALHYTQRIGERTRLTASYRFGFQQGESADRYYNLNQWDGTSAWKNTQPGNRTSIDSLSHTSLTGEQEHRFRLNMRTQWEKLELDAALEVVPARTNAQTKQTDGTLRQDTAFASTTYSPQLRLVYRLGKDKIELQYQGTNQRPSTASLLAVADYRNPLYVREGNPDLKQSFDNLLKLNWKHRFCQLEAEWGNTLHAISYQRIYDEQTGATRIRPQNIEGNWQAGVTAEMIHTAGDFSFELGGEYKFEKEGEHIYASALHKARKSSTRTQQVTLMPVIQYATQSVESTLLAEYCHNRSRNSLRGQGIRTNDYLVTWDFTYNFPCHLALHSNYSYQSRRGYNMADMNTDEHVWNLGVSYRFLKKKRGRIRAEFYDVLHQRSNLKHRTTASGWSEQRYAKTNSYFLLSFSYQLSSFF